MGTAVSSKAQQSAVTRKAILDACLKLFARHGFSTTSIDDIASAAGITKGAVYWHFENKEELFQAILDRKSTRLNSSHQIISYAVFCLKKKKISGRRAVAPQVTTA